MAEKPGLPTRSGQHLPLKSISPTGQGGSLNNLSTFA